jgi:hypothetical protein
MRLVIPDGSPIADAVTLVDMQRTIGVAQSVEAAEAQIRPSAPSSIEPSAANPAQPQAAPADPARREP